MTLIDNDNATDTDDRVMISFTRRLDTGDDTDDISLLGCHYLLWAWAGPVNDYTTTPATIGRHGQRGVFDDQICCGSKFIDKLYYISYILDSIAPSHSI